MGGGMAFSPSRSRWGLPMAAALVLTAVACGSRVSDPAADAPQRGQPMPARQELTEVSWNLLSQFPDGRRFVSDRCILLDASYVKGPFPPATLAPEKVEPFLNRATTHGFGLADLEAVPPNGNYRAPDGTLLNRKYVTFLKHLDTIKELHFRGSKVDEPVLILDGRKVIGALVPMIVVDE